MGIEDARNWADIDHSPDTTIEELVQQYGFEAVRRSLTYMESLSDAQDNYVNSVEENQLKKGLKEAGVEGPEEAFDELSREWVDNVEESGIGLDE